MGSSECPAKIVAQFRPPQNTVCQEACEWPKSHISVMSAEQRKQWIAAAPDTVQHMNEDDAARLQIVPVVTCKPANMNICIHASSTMAFALCWQGWASPARAPHSASPCRPPAMLAFVEAIPRQPDYTQVAAAADRLMPSRFPQQMYTRSDC